MNQLQFRITRSALTLFASFAYGLVVWLCAGGITQQWWPQLACVAVSVFLMVELSNSNALLRVRSRMVTSTFIIMLCMAPFIFGSLRGAVVQLCFVAMLTILFTTYQDDRSPGRIFYSFVFFGIASVASVHLLYLAPLIWILMRTQLQSLSWRTWAASIFGMILPYWFAAIWMGYRQDFTPMAQHFAQLGQFQFPFDYASVSLSQVITYVFTTVVTVVGVVHFWHNSFQDKIRIRLIYGIFTWLSLLSLVIIAVQPQFYDPMIRIAMLCGSPFIAHYLTLGTGRVVNIFFFSAIALTLAISIVNLWIF